MPRSCAAPRCDRRSGNRKSRGDHAPGPFRTEQRDAVRPQRRAFHERLHLQLPHKLPIDVAKIQVHVTDVTAVSMQSLLPPIQPSLRFLARHHPVQKNLSAKIGLQIIHADHL
jgi:hypothetical protein